MFGWSKPVNSYFDENRDEFGRHLFSSFSLCGLPLRSYFHFITPSTSQIHLDSSSMGLLSHQQRQLSSALERRQARLMFRTRVCGSDDSRLGHVSNEYSHAPTKVDVSKGSVPTVEGREDVYRRLFLQSIIIKLGYHSSKGY